MPPPTSRINRRGPHIKSANADVIASRRFTDVCKGSVGDDRPTVELTQYCQQCDTHQEDYREGQVQSYTDISDQHSTNCDRYSIGHLSTHVVNMVST